MLFLFMQRYLIEIVIHSLKPNDVCLFDDVTNVQTKKFFIFFCYEVLITFRISNTFQSITSYMCNSARKYQTNFLFSKIRSRIDLSYHDVSSMNNTRDAISWTVRSKNTCFPGVVCYCWCMTQQLEKYGKFIALKLSLCLLPTQSGRHVITYMYYILYMLRTLFYCRSVPEYERHHSKHIITSRAIAFERQATYTHLKNSERLLTRWRKQYHSAIAACSGVLWP